MAHLASSHSPRPTEFTIGRIRVGPMSGQQREQAVTALATLITAWQHSRHHDAEDPGDDSGVPLPTPGAPSNTDHAA